jgi:hypothetical protein
MTYQPHDKNTSPHGARDAPKARPKVTYNGDGKDCNDALMLWGPHALSFTKTVIFDPENPKNSIPEPSPAPDGWTPEIALMMVNERRLQIGMPPLEMDDVDIDEGPRRKPTDVNDILRASGPDAVREAIEAGQIDIDEEPPSIVGPSGPMPDDEPELELFDAGDEDGNLSPRQWLLGTAFCRTYLSGLVSAGAAGKTTFRILQALSLATGRPLSGEYVHKRSAASLRFALGPLSGSARLPMPRL